MLSSFSFNKLDLSVLTSSSPRSDEYVFLRGRPSKRLPYNIFLRPCACVCVRVRVRVSVVAGARVAARDE